MTFPYQIVSQLKWTLHAEEPTITSPENKTVPPCSIVNPDFLELILPHFVSQSEVKDIMRPRYFENSGGNFEFYSPGMEFLLQGVKISYRKHQQ